MRSKFARDLCVKSNVTQNDVIVFLAFLKHIKKGHDETSNCLAFYMEKEASLKLDQTEEVLDMRTVYDKFKTLFK